MRKICKYIKKGFIVFLEIRKCFELILVEKMILVGVVLFYI